MEWFVIAQVVGPAILYLPGTQVFRVPIRIGPFAISLIALAYMILRRSYVRPHSSWIWLAGGGVYMALMIFNPSTNSYMSGIAQTAMHVAIAAPAAWACGYFFGDYRRLERILLILWALNAASAGVGILQVRDPVRWMPAQFSSNTSGGQYGVTMYQYINDQGEVKVRPPGLGDAPGAACGAGIIVSQIGLAFIGLGGQSPLRKLMGFGSIILGLSVIFLTHVRSALVVVVGSFLVFLIILVLQKRWKLVILLILSMVTCGSIGLEYASSLGGKSIRERFATLVDADVVTVYDRSARMGMVSGSLDTLLVEYPFGAGLGRWGMMRVYFGNESNTDSPSIWAEVQFASWVLDGGIVLLTLYLGAIAVAIFGLLKLVITHPSRRLREWGAVVLMLNAAPVALLFSYVPFHSQMGMQFWLLVGAISGVCQGENFRLSRGFPASDG